MTHRLTRAAAAAAAVLLAGLLPTGARAQEVGYPPARSPFEDLEFRQNFSLLGGYFAAKADPVGVAPRGGALLGLQYDLGFGGPAILTTRVRTVFSERTAIDPALPAGRRVLGTEQRPLTLADVGLTLALTGNRTYHGIVPLVHGGAGIATTFAGADPGGYTPGTSFALVYGLGVRYVPRGQRLSFRGDVGSTLYRVRYPSGYAVAGIDSTSVLPANASLTRWLNNLSVTAGVSYQFRR